MIERDIQYFNDPFKYVVIDDFFSKEDLEMYIKFFEDMSNLKVENKAGNMVPYLDYISKFRDEYIENYTNKNLN